MHRTDVDRMVPLGAWGGMSVPRSMGMIPVYIGPMDRVRIRSLVDVARASRMRDLVDAEIVGLRAVVDRLVVRSELVAPSYGWSPSMVYVTRRDAVWTVSPVPAVWRATGGQIMPCAVVHARCGSRTASWPVYGLGGVDTHVEAWAGGLSR